MGRRPFVFDDVDRVLLDEMQQDCDRSAKQLSLALDRRGFQLNGPAIAARITRLVDEGYIAKRVAVLDPEKCGFETFFVHLKLKHSSPNAEAIVREAVAKIDEIVEHHAVLGHDTIDHILKVRARNNRHADRVSVQLRSFLEELHTTTVVVGTTHREEHTLPIFAPDENGG